MAAQEIAELKDQIARLQVRLQTTAKDMSLVTLIPKWSGTSRSGSLNEFLNSVESAANMGNWDDRDKISIATLKLEDTARTFAEAAPEFQKKDLKWSEFKAALQKRFRDPRSEQYNFLQLQTVKQKPGEPVLAFADRCRILAQNVAPKVEDPLGQIACNQQTERMLLASFLSGLQGAVGLHTKFALPASLEDAIRIATAIEQAGGEKGAKSDAFYLDRRADGFSVPRKKKAGYRGRRKENSVDRNSQRCSVCEGFGHFASVCPTRIAREQEAEKPKQFRSYGDKPIAKRPDRYRRRDPAKTGEPSGNC